MNARQKLYHIKRVDKIIFLIFLTLFPILMILLNDDDEPILLQDYFMWFWLSLDACILVYLIVFRWLKKSMTTTHYFLLAGKILLASLTLFAIGAVLYLSLFEGTGDSPIEITASDVVTMVIFILFLSSILLGIIMFKKGIEAQIQVLKNESIQKSNELRILKSQIDPHFLFNNLNTLDAFVETNSERARQFIQRMAKLYQYLLATKDEDTVTLTEEMNFSKDYIYLIKERFGDNYQFQITDKNKAHDEMLIPPGAIQTVFENIVKHNSASKVHPIITEVTVEENHIVVRNNIRSKKIPAASFGIGLTNLQARYQILTRQSVKVNISTHYTITLPLIKSL